MMNHDSPPLSCDVWIFHHGNSSVLNGLQESVLSDEEQQRAAAYRDAGRRTAFIASRVGIRELLAFYLLVEPGDVLLSRLPSGRPIVTHPSRPCGLPISISHTANAVCLAVASAGCRVGVDIERLDNLAYTQSLFRTVIAAQERHLFAGLNVAAQRRLMLEIWTIKEATYKAVGCGQRRPMTDFVVDGQPGALRLLSAPGRNADARLAQFRGLEPTDSEKKPGSRADALFGSLVVNVVQPQEASEAVADGHSFARVRENHNSIVDRMVQSGLECSLEEFHFGAATAPAAGRSGGGAARSLATTGSSAGGS